jgi:hypothetical protein
MVTELLRQPQATTDRGTPRYSSAASSADQLLPGLTLEERVNTFQSVADIINMQTATKFCFS